MSVSSISDLSRQHMLNILGATNTAQTAQAATTGSSSTFAQMLSDLQQLEKADPKQYSKVTHQISKDLSHAASSVQGQGNATLASQLTSLSQQFASASSSAAGTTSSNPLQMIGSMVGKALGI